MPWPRGQASSLGFIHRQFAAGAANCRWGDLLLLPFPVKEGQLAIYVNGSDLRRLRQSFPRPFEKHYAGANSFPRHLSELYACGRLPINRYHQGSDLRRTFPRPFENLYVGP